jgi:lysophospholipid acyltransferase (LPLAT)-like uncharacterized protein
MFLLIDAKLMRSSQSLDRPYHFADLSSYSSKDRFLIRIGDLAFYFSIRLLGLTVRFEVEDYTHYEEVGRAGKLPIMAFWHEFIFLTTYWWRERGIVVLTSQSRDGEYIARFIQRLGYGAVRGSSTRGAVGAVIELARQLRGGRAVGFVVDGPKGPRRKAKMGAVLLAKKTGHPVLPFVTAAHKCWRLSNWDRLQIPKPFTRAKIIVAAPIYVPADASDAMLDTFQAQLQSALEALDQRIEAWRASL